MACLVRANAALRAALRLPGRKDAVDIIEVAVIAVIVGGHVSPRFQALLPLDVVWLVF